MAHPQQLESRKAQIMERSKSPEKVMCEQDYSTAVYILPYIQLLQLSRL